MDDLWRNGVLIEKEGDQEIQQFKIPEHWTPPPEKSGEKKFEDMDNQGKRPWYSYHPEFKKNYYLGHQLLTEAINVPEDDHGQSFKMIGDFYTVDSKAYKADTQRTSQDMDQHGETYSWKVERHVLIRIYFKGQVLMLHR